MFADRVANLAWTGVGLYVAWLARDLGVGEFNQPGPGMLAFGLGVLIAAVGAASFVWPLLRRPLRIAQLDGAPLLPPPQRTLILCIGLAAYFAVLQPIGFPIATFVLLLLLFALFANLSWLRAAGFAAVAAVSSYALFKFALGTQLPAGILG